MNVVPEVRVPEQAAVEHIDWQFLQKLKALESAIDPSVLDGDIMQSLRINEENINQELETQPSQTFMYAAIAIRMKKILQIFEATILKLYQAHVHSYAKLFMKAIGEKDTLDGRKEYAIKLFGRDAQEQDRRNNAEMAIRGEKLLVMTQSKLDKTITSAASAWAAEVDAFVARMYPESLAPYEAVIEQHEDMKEKKELADSLADTFRQRGISVTSIASNLRSGAMGEGLRLRHLGSGGGGFNAFLLSKLRKALEMNPEAPDEMLVQIMNSHL